MNVERNYETNIIRLDENTFWDSERFVKKDVKKQVEIFKQDFRMYLNILKRVVESDFKKLTDKELYDLLSTIYDIYLDQFDYLKMLSIDNNKRYTKFWTIPTTMVFKSLVTEGHGRSFDYWEQPFQAYYDVALSDDFLPQSKPYTKEEIKDLIENKNIVLLKRREREFNGGKDFNREEFEEFKTLDLDLVNKHPDTSFRINSSVFANFASFGKLLRKEFPKKRVLSDIREIIMDLNYDLEEVFQKGSDTPYCAKISILCEEWYEKSNEKKEFENIQKRIKAR